MHWNVWVHCCLAPSYQALMAGYQMHWSSSTSIHNPPSRLAALTGTKHSLSRGMPFLSHRTVDSGCLVTHFLLCHGSEQGGLIDLCQSSSYCRATVKSVAPLMNANNSQWLDETLWKKKKILFLSKELSDWCSLQHLSFVNSCLPRDAVINHKCCGALAGFAALQTHCKYRCKPLLQNLTFFFFQFSLQRHVLQLLMSAFSHTLLL